MTANVSASRRYTKERRCPICDGAPTDPRGAERRCIGFLSADGDFAHCSREERSGAIKISEGSGTFGHRRRGPCGCGVTHAEALDERSGNIEYDYVDENRALIFRVVRTPDKRFWQRRPDGAGGWMKGDGIMQGVRRVPYRLPELLAADPNEPVYIAEGEKDVDNLRARGFIATTSSQGAKNWRHTADEANSALRNRQVIILPDDDDDGRAYANSVKASLRGVAASVRICRLPAKDVSDWFAAGHTADELREIVASGLDDEQSGTGNSEPNQIDPWQQALERARADVQKAIGAQRDRDRRPLFATDAVHLLQADFPPTQWLITGLITKGSTAVVAGEPKAGIKTWILLEGAIAVATGTKMFGEFYAEEGGVAIFFAEDKAQAARNRVRSLLAGADRTIPEGKLFLQPRGEFIDLLNDEDMAWIVASVRRLPKIVLLVLDPFRDVHTAAEDKSDEMSPVMKRLRLLGELLGCTVWISHHTPKVTKDTSKRRPGQNMRGSSAIHGSVDNGIYVEPLDGDGTTNFKAQLTSQIKDARSAGTFELELSIEDDESGAAVKATWARNEKPKGADRRNSDDDSMFDFVRELAMRGDVSTKTKLRDHDSCPIPDKRARVAIDRLIENGRLLLQKGQVKIPGSEGSKGQPK